jgi:hypothetical protein
MNTRHSSCWSLERNICRCLPRSRYAPCPTRPPLLSTRSIVLQLGTVYYRSAVRCQVSSRRDASFKRSLHAHEAIDYFTGQVWVALEPLYLRIPSHGRTRSRNTPLLLSPPATQFQPMTPFPQVILSPRLRSSNRTPAYHAFVGPRNRFKYCLKLYIYIYIYNQIDI